METEKHNAKDNSRKQERWSLPAQRSTGKGIVPGKRSRPPSGDPHQRDKDGKGGPHVFLQSAHICLGKVVITLH